MANAQWILPTFPKQQTADENEEEFVLQDTIQNMMDDEQVEPIVLGSST